MQLKIHYAKMLPRLRLRLKSLQTLAVMQVIKDAKKMLSLLLKLLRMLQLLNQLGVRPMTQHVKMQQLQPLAIGGCSVS